MQIRTFPDGATWVRWLCEQFDPTWGKPALTPFHERHCAHCYMDDARWRSVPIFDPVPLVHIVYVCETCAGVTCMARVIR